MKIENNNISNVMFEEEVKMDKVISLYFTAPREILEGEYPEAVSCEICIELPSDNPVAENATVMISPTKPEGEDVLTDYDWNHFELPAEDIKKLISLSRQGVSDKEYVVYRTPIGTILLDWNDTLWTSGYPYFSKNHCTEIERGFCEGGKKLGAFYAQLKKKYGADITSEEEVRRTHEWELQQMRR